MTYQDRWANGAVIEKGYRECSSRYDVVRKFCLATFGKRKAFTVRDIGANVCYFGMRLTEDFPNCRVFSYESHYGAIRVARYHVEKYGNDRMELSHAKVTIKQVDNFERCDLILAMSILHHMPEGQAAWLDALRGACDHLIVELATESKARNSQRGHKVPDGATVIGYGSSHLEVSVRPIFHMEGTRLLANSGVS